MRKLAVFAGAFSLGTFLTQYLLWPERLLPGAHGVQFIPRLGTTYLYQAGRLVEKE